VTTTQAVILARGLGTRMRRSDGTSLGAVERAVAETGVKAMMPFERPFLDYVLSSLADAGIDEVVLVIGPEHSSVRTYYTETAKPTRLAVRFAVQEKPRGTADAVFAARDAVRNAPFLVLNSDNYYPTESFARLAEMAGNGLVAFEAEALVRESGIEPERVWKYALVDIAPDESLREIREKPTPSSQLPTASWVSMNLWSFTPVIFEACQRVMPSPRGELEVQDAVTIAMRDLGVRFGVVRAGTSMAGVLDLSQRADVAVVRERLAGITPRP
jgi:dTDP-glucose pyrophosphorylase